ncbi:MAG TPA: serine/threonine-protein kinase, partial [Blastocatellia bacterium]|nr:serine/threonine-protein kinase [Blastocatellia bacterium]
MKRCPQCGQEYKDSARFCPRDGYNLDIVASEPTLLGSNPISVPDPAAPDPLIGQVLAGRYRLLQKIGQGGMGAVYKGQHVKMNRMTAIKILTSELANDPQFVARFEREAEMASKIDHPNAVGIYDFGEAEGGLVYIAMEFIEGQPLSSIIEKEGALALDRVVKITYQAAEALQAAHSLGIIHRDFKPDNIMICQKLGRPDWVEVVDFGIAKRAAVEPDNQALTQTGFVLGTPQYMSPEQVAGEPLDLRSDLYSLAIVSYEMLTGALPFGGNSPQSVMVNRLLQPPMPLRKVRPSLAVPPAVEAVIMKALARYPVDRYSSTM